MMILWSNLLIWVGLTGFCTIQAQTQKLPDNLLWSSGAAGISNSQQIKKVSKEGIFVDSWLSFPRTLLTLGPAAHPKLKKAIRDNQWALTSRDNVGGVFPLLASQWATGLDKRTVYYRIDPLARWSDGHKVSAKDFYFSWQSIKSKHWPDPWQRQWSLEHIEQVKIYDQNTISVTMRHMTANLLQRTNLTPLPSHFIKKVDPSYVKKYNWKIIPNTGPYQINEISKDRGFISFKRKNNWWAKNRLRHQHQFNAEIVRFVALPDEEVIWEAFKRKKLSIIKLKDLTLFNKRTRDPLFKNGGGTLEYWSGLPAPCYGIWINSEKASWLSKNLKEGISHSFNFQRVNLGLLQNKGKRLKGCFDGYGPWSIYRQFPKFDEKTAQKLFMEAGWRTRNGEGIRISNQRALTLKIMFGDELDYNQLLILQQEAKKTGLKIELEQVKSEKFLERLKTGDYEAVFAGFAPWQTNPQFQLIWHSKGIGQGTNFSRINNQELDRMINQYDAELSYQVRLKLAHNIQNKAYDLGWFIPGLHGGWQRSVFWRWWRLPVPSAPRPSPTPWDHFHPSYGGLFWYDSKLERAMGNPREKAGISPREKIVDKTWYRD
ncbi:MAG: hypothetical protein CMP10_20880 [Zetaproteobacteria bacterium]|nr:hypothetical protein [Pseudobdellovibrionaceae bacterium]